MDIKEAQALLRSGVEPSPDYPDLPNDFTAEQLIAYDPKAELEYRMAKDRHPGMTRAMLMRQWKPFRIGRIWSSDDGGNGNAGGNGSSFLRKVADIIMKRQN